MPDKNKQSKSQWVVILSCTMAGFVIGMMLMQQFRFNAAEGARLGAMFGGIGAGLGALAGQVIVWLKKLSRQAAVQPAEPERLDDVPVARPVRSSELQPGESALPIVEIDETSPPVSSRRGEAQRAGVSKSPNSVVPDVVVAVVGAVIGIVLLAITATNALVPVVAAAMVGTLAYAVGNERFRPMAPAFAAQAGHLAWMVLGALLLNQSAPVGVDVVILGAGLLWLAVHPGLAPVIVLSIYQAILFGMNMHSLETCSVVNLELALSVHMVLRGFALAALWIGWLRMYLLAKGQPVELPATVISGRGHEADSDIAAGQYEQLEPLFDDWRAPAASREAAVNPAPASAYLAGAATAAAALYATLVVWHWMAWGMLVTCLALIAASVAKFVAYQRQSIDRKTAASETWGYTGLAANVVSLLLIACVTTATVVSTPTVARRPAAQPPSFAVNPSLTGSNARVPLPRQEASKAEDQERIRKMQAEAAAQQAETDRKREEERQAALKPQWHPFQSTDNGPPGWVLDRPGEADPAQRNLLRWKGIESAFRIASLRMPLDFVATGDGEHVAWSRDGQWLYIVGRDNYLYQISVGDWTAKRRLRLWPAAQSIYFCKDWLVVVRGAFVNQFSNFQVLVVDPETLVPTRELDLPTAFEVRAASGSVESRFLFAVDREGQMLTAIDLEFLDPGSGPREAKLTQIPIAHRQDAQGPHILAVTPDGKTVVYNELGYMVVVDARDGRFSSTQVQLTLGNWNQVQVSANSQRLVCRKGSSAARSSWSIYDFANLQKPALTFPVGQLSSPPAIDAVSGAILKSHNGEFSVLDPLGKEIHSLSLENAVQQAVDADAQQGTVARNPARRSLEGRILAHPKGNRCLVWGDRWAVWLEWDDDKN